jgi:hypothetical protein
VLRVTTNIRVVPPFVLLLATSQLLWYDTHRNPGRWLLLNWIPITLVTLTLLCGVSDAAIIRVDCTGGGDYLTIQEGVNAASDGDTVLVAACAYTERVLIPNTKITIDGSGTENTELSWHGLDPTLESGDEGLIIRDMTIRKDPIWEYAIRWDDRRLVLEDCSVQGRIWGGGYYACVTLNNSIVSRLGTTGGGVTSYLEHSRIDTARFSGIAFEVGHSVESFESTYGSLDHGNLTEIHSENDSIGSLRVQGGLDVFGYVAATGSTIDRLLATTAPFLELSDCLLGELTYLGDEFSDDRPSFAMDGCIILRDLEFDFDPGIVTAARDTRSESIGPVYGVDITHNTILGGFSFGLYDEFAEGQFLARGNIVVGSTDITSQSNLVVSHNDFVGGSVIDVAGDSVYANIGADPLFCGDILGDYTLQDCSPCLGAAHDGGDIGAYGVGCECQDAASRTSWGRVKSMLK